MQIVVFGLSITSSWGNGHATTYRSLLRALSERGHRVLFLERDLPWYAENRDLPCPSYARTEIYTSLEDLHRFTRDVESADHVIVGSYTSDGIDVGRFVQSHATGVTAFYDIDTPVTVAALEDDRCEYLSRDQVPRYHMYLSFTGGPTLHRLEQEFGSPMARPLYCSVDTDLYRPSNTPVVWDLGYLGTYSRDRQLGLETRLLEPARQWPSGRFVVAGPQFPEEILWPPNVERIVHLSPSEHPWFYNAQRFTLNLTRSAMVRAGYSPSVRLFEAAACATPIISDSWNGLEQFFEADKEILITTSAEETLSHLRTLGPDAAAAIGARARARVLASHTAKHRACELESYVAALRADRAAPRAGTGHPGLARRSVSEGGRVA
jgi:spore maturation protein CgeB